MTTNYVFLGSGTTDSNGVAKLDHDANGDPISHSYTGVGAGEIDLVASTDNPITSSSCQSEPYPVYDTLFYDKAISGTGNHNDNYENVANLVRANDGTSIDTAWIYARPKINNSTSIDITNDTCFEVTVPSLTLSDGQFRVVFNDGENKIYWINYTGTYRFEIKDKIYVYKDDETSPSSSINLSSVSSITIGLVRTTANVVAKFKDVKIYPI